MIVELAELSLSREVRDLHVGFSQRSRQVNDLLGFVHSKIVEGSGQMSLVYGLGWIGLGFYSSPSICTYNSHTTTVLYMIQMFTVS